MWVGGGRIVPDGLILNTYSSINDHSVVLIIYAPLKRWFFLQKEDFICVQTTSIIDEIIFQTIQWMKPN